MYEGDDIPENLRSFYKFVRTGKASDELTKDLEQAVEVGRMNRAYCLEYIKQEQMRMEIVEEERIHTEEQRKRADAAEARAAEAEAEVERLKRLLAKAEG